MHLRTPEASCRHSREHETETLWFKGMHPHPEQSQQGHHCGDRGDEHTSHKASPLGCLRQPAQRGWWRRKRAANGEGTQGVFLSSVLNSSPQLGQICVLSLSVPREAFRISCGGRDRRPGNRFIRRLDTSWVTLHELRYSASRNKRGKRRKDKKREKK